MGPKHIKQKKQNATDNSGGEKLHILLEEIWPHRCKVKSLAIINGKTTERGYLRRQHVHV